MPTHSPGDWGKKGGQSQVLTRNEMQAWTQTINKWTKRHIVLTYKVPAGATESTYISTQIKHVKTYTVPEAGKEIPKEIINQTTPKHLEAYTYTQEIQNTVHNFHRISAP